tara:strand:+ start:60 stop:719 length:660 start_codon:yes stop_codon:yes gene_type:complete
MNAICPVWKPVDVVSNDIVRIAKKNPHMSNKVGHAGTLDPFAEGILVLCFGEDTKKVSDIMAMKKEYFGKIKLGVETDTLDKTGEVYKTSQIPSLNDDMIQIVFDKFNGKINQNPPAYSALKLNGKRLYEYARSGIRIIKKAREITIDSLELVDYNGSDLISFKTICSSGTYIRSLASDLAKELGTHGYLEELQRSKIGDYTRENCLSMEELVNGNIKR